MSEASSPLLLEEVRMTELKRELDACVDVVRKQTGLQPELGLVLGSGLGFLADQVVDPQQGRELAARLPGATLQLLPGLGHLGHEEDPQRFAQIIVQLFDGDAP